MEKSYTRSRTRLVAFLFSILLLLLITIPISLPIASVVTPQGKGGEVIAKPTPTPKKTPPPKNRSVPAKSNKSSSNTGSNSLSEIAFWETIKNSTDPEDFKAYLKKYPNGQFVDLTRNRLNALETAAKEAAARKEEARLKEEEAKKVEAKRKELEALKRPGAVVKNSIGMELVYVPPGSFMMGSTNGGADEKPVHQVTISQAFYIGRYEVTQAQWQSVMGNNPSYFKDCGGNCPVEQVSWDDAQNFINKLNESNDGFSYRLPTEAEWEYACRAGTNRDYAGNLDEMAWYSANSGSETHAVGGKQPNGFGLYDTLGNVWEWCRDWYDANYYASSPATDPQGPGSGQYRVLRGVSWNYDAARLRSAFRGWNTPDYRGNYHGFRVVAVARTP